MTFLCQLINELILLTTSAIDIAHNIYFNFKIPMTYYALKFNINSTLNKYNLSTLYRR